MKNLTKKEKVSEFERKSYAICVFLNLASPIVQLEAEIGKRYRCLTNFWMNKLRGLMNEAEHI